VSSDRALDSWRQYFRANSGLWVPLGHIERIRNSATYDDLYFLAKTDVTGEDADGETGTYTATFQCVPNPSTSLEINLGVSLGGRSLFTIDADYATWPDHHRLRVQTFGVREDQATPSVGAIPYVLADGTLFILPLKQRVRYRGARAYGVIDWRDDLMDDSYHRNQGGGFEDLRPAWDAVREFMGIKRKPGGRPRGKVPPDPGFADRFYRALRTRYDGGNGQTERPSQEQVAGDLGESVDTLQRRIVDVPLPWPPPWPPE
jgi:hypothetical protein